jgi:hypothetical protein|tara:strand:+ start:259 stop:1056 length:798 start_codon:yes stop_codon:yes gene_type:complete
MENNQQSTQQDQSLYQFPTEEVTLPSKGILYPEESPLKSGIIEMKYMTAKEEDILTNQNLIKNGTVIDKLLQSLIITNIDYNELLIGDKNAILIASRILGYGQEYSFKYPHPTTGEEETVTVDLTESEDKVLDESLVKDNKNEFKFTLPHSKIDVTFKLLCHGDESKIEQEIKGLKKISKLTSADLTTRLKHMILSVNGDYTVKSIRNFVDNAFLARDARALREYAGSIMPDADLTFDINFKDGASAEGVTIPIGTQFFWPESTI